MLCHLSWLEQQELSSCDPVWYQLFDTAHIPRISEHISTDVKRCQQISTHVGSFNITCQPRQVATDVTCVISCARIVFPSWASHMMEPNRHNGTNIFLSFAVQALRWQAFFSGREQGRRCSNQSQQIAVN